MSRRALLLAVAMAACSSDTTEPDANAPARTWRMGFSAIPPRPSESDLLAALDMWTRRADAAIIHTDVPWAALLSGTSASAAVQEKELQLANYFRAKNLQLFITVDATDGLNRSAEAPALVQLGRSITEPAVQQVYRQYVLALSSIVKPDYLGLAAETNLIRALSPATLYAALVQMTNDAAADLQAAGSTSTRYVSIQVDAAWGRLLQEGTWQGVEQDFTDFPFIQALGLSSYPYFVFDDPDEIPLDYYSRVRGERTIPMMVVEGGWTSGVAGDVVSTPAEQKRYIRRHAALLDSARAVAVFQLTFTDLDVPSLGLPPESILPLFALLGLVDTELAPKPALAIWDSLFAVRRVN